MGSLTVISLFLVTDTILSKDNSLSGSEPAGDQLMTKYLIVYFGGNPPETPEEGQKHFADYKQWLQSLGDSVVSAANPIKDTHTIKPDGQSLEGGNSQMSGYTIIQADSMDKALELAASCPFLSIGGHLEVSEKVNMSI